MAHAHVRERERGASMIEVIGATAILGIVVAAFLYLTQHMVVSDAKTSGETRALRVAEEKLHFARAYLEERGNLPPNESDPGGYSVVYQLASLNGPVAYHTASFGERHLSLQSVVLVQGAGGPPQPMLLTATVSWEE